MLKKLLLAGTCFLPTMAAQSHDAVLTAIQGQVSVRRLGKEKYARAHKEEVLSFGDRIKTGPKSLAHIKWTDRAAVLVREKSVLTLQGSTDHIRIHFSIGEFLVGLKKRLTQGQSFEIAVPSAVAAIRGTLFWGRTDADKTAAFASFGDVVWITAEGKTVELKPGEKTVIHPARIPSNPEPSGIALTYLNNFKVRGNLEGLDSLVDQGLRRPQ